MCPNMNDASRQRDETPYMLRYVAQFLLDPINSVFNGSEFALYLGPKIQEQIPTEINNKDSLVGFKKEIREWKPLIALAKSANLLQPTYVLFNVL